MERPKSPERLAFEQARAEVVRMKGREILRTQWAETLHTANAILRQKDQYDPEVVKIQEHTRNVAYGVATSTGLTTIEADHICEDEWNLRREEEARHDRENDFSS